MKRKAFEVLEARRLLAVTPLPSVEAPPEPVGGAIVRGNVFRDLNRDGLRTSNEPGQANIRVYLDYDNNGTRDGDAEPIAITNSLGGYRFENAHAPATIAARLLLTDTNFLQTRPAGNAARVVTTAAGGNYELESFGVNEPVVVPPPPPPVVTVLTGIVYTDLNRNGVRDGAEKGRANVSVYIDANTNGTHEEGEPLTKTNVEGRYRFEAAGAGPKTLRLLLAGTNLTQTQPVDNQPVFATAIDGQVNEADAFGVAEVPITPPPPTTAIVTGNVFYDTNQNATRDNAEAGRGNVRVYLDLDNDSVRDAEEPSVISDSNGRYGFDAAPVRSDLRIRLDLSATALKQTLPAANAARVIATAAGQTYVDQNFGVHEIVVTPPPVTTAIVSGNVFYDTNQNAKRDNGEVGRANVRVYLDLNNNAKRDEGEPSLLTNSVGHYQFSTAPVRGDLRIRLDLAGTPLKQTFPAGNGARVLATSAGSTYVDQNFGVHEITVTPPPAATGTVRGRVFNDVNHNGKQDAGDLGVPNRSVYIDANLSGYRESSDPQTLTDANGNYVFEKIAPGTYDVRLYRAGLTQTSPAGNNPNVAVVKAGGVAGDLFFGTYQTPVVAKSAAALSVTPTKLARKESDFIKLAILA